MHRDHTQTGEPTVSPVVLPEFGPAIPRGDVTRPLSGMDEVPVTVSVVAGRAQMTMHDVERLEPGSVVELDRLPEDSAEVFVNGVLAATGDVVVVDGVLAARIGEFRTGKP